MAALISVIVPIYNVEPYLAACLTSVARQSHRQLQIVLVDDGSTDGSAGVARSFTQVDDRFTLLRQANAGLGATRNAGVERAAGDYLAFVDGDDVVPPYAYELLHATLESTGSAFAGGAVGRFGPAGTRRAGMHATAYSANEPATHVSRKPELLLDRMVTNKLWRRTFWDGHGLRFPEGVLYEDIEVALGAHVLAPHVDVLNRTVYWWRERPAADRSITQRRTVAHGVTDRLRALRAVTELMAARGLHDLRREYEAAALAHELTLFVDAADVGDREYRELLVREVGSYLRGLHPSVLERQSAIDRLKYHFVARGMVPELLQTLAFERTRVRDAPTLGSGERRYGEYVFRRDPARRVPGEVYRLRTELSVQSGVTSVRWRKGRLHVAGFAYIERVSSPDPRTVSSRLVLRSSETGREVSVPVSGRHDEAATRHGGSATHCYDGAGFTAVIDPGGILAHEPAPAVVEVHVEVQADGITRRGPLTAADDAALPRQRWRRAEDGRFVTVGIAVGMLQLRVQEQHAQVRRLESDGATAEIDGIVTSSAGRPRMLLAAHAEGGEVRRLALTSCRRTKGRVDRYEFTARLDLARFVDAEQTPPDVHAVEETKWAARWQLSVKLRNGDQVPLAMPADVEGVAVEVDGREVALRTSTAGKAVLFERLVRPVLTAASWEPGGTLLLEGRLPGVADTARVVLRRRGSGHHHVLPALADGRRVMAALALVAEPDRGGLALPDGTWRVLISTCEETAASPVPATIAPKAAQRLPLELDFDGRRYSLQQTADATLQVVVAEFDAPTAWDDARQRRRMVRRGRLLPRRDVVVFDSWGGPRFGGDVRAIFDELSRRPGPPGMWVRPHSEVRLAGAPAVRRGSAEHAEALTRARWIVTDHLLPEWWTPARNQRVVQTWHGVPVKHVGADLPDPIAAAAPYWLAELRRQSSAWKVLVSAGTTATQRLRDALGYSGRVLEVGAPRTDVQHRSDLRRARAVAVRRCLGIGAHERVALWAPTARDDGWTGRRRRRLGVAAPGSGSLRSQTSGFTLLVHGHPALTEPPVGIASAWRDVTALVDVHDLLLVADVLVSDYSSLVLDFLHTGRPIVLYMPDVDEFCERGPGLGIDLRDRAPGRVVSTPQDAATALLEAEHVRHEYSAAYAALAGQWCGPRDGQASARVVDYLLS